MTSLQPGETLNHWRSNKKQTLSVAWCYLYPVFLVLLRPAETQSQRNQSKKQHVCGEDWFPLTCTSILESAAKQIQVLSGSRFQPDPVDVDQTDNRRPDRKTSLSEYFHSERNPVLRGGTVKQKKAPRLLLSFSEHQRHRLRLNL